MRSLRIFAVFFVFTFSAQSALSQCCCSGVSLTITDGSGYPLQRADLKISEIVRKDNGRIAFHDSAETRAKFHFQMGCASGRDTLVIESGSSTMRIRFKFYGEFGHPNTDIVFTHGDYVAELVNEGDDEYIIRKVVLRPGDAEEMKEIEPTPDKDGDANETTQDLGPLFETRGAVRFAGCDRSFWPGASDIFSAYRNG
jgi:hypothetical protein